MFHQIWAACAAGVATFGALGTVDGPSRLKADADVAELVNRASEAHASLMRGDIAGYRKAIRVTPDFTLLDPFGGEPRGAPSSEEHWARIGRFFRDGRAARFELIGTYRSADLLVLVAKETAHVAVGSLPAQEWSLRVTLVFRRDDGEWRLAHRHADPLVKGVSLSEAGRITLGTRTER